MMARQLSAALFIALLLVSARAEALFMSSGGAPSSGPPQPTIVSVAPTAVSIPDTTAQGSTIIQYVCTLSDQTTPQCTYTLHAGSVLPGYLTLQPAGAVVTNAAPVLPDGINTWSVDAVIGAPPQTISQISLSCAPGCGFNVPTASGTTIGNLAVAMSPAAPPFAGALALIGSDGNQNCTHTDDTTNFQITGLAPNFVLATNGTAQTATTYYVCVAATQSGLISVTREFSVVGTSTTQSLGATNIICSSGGSGTTSSPCLFPSGQAGIVGSLSTAMSQPPAFSGTYSLVNTLAPNGCADAGNITSFSVGAGTSNNILSTSGPASGTFNICVKITQGSATNSPQYQEFVAAVGVSTYEPATSMSCSLSCGFVPGTAGAVGSLATGNTAGGNAFTGSYLLVSSGCVDPGDTTHFSLSGANVNTTAPSGEGVPYRICVQTTQNDGNVTRAEFTIVGTALSAGSGSVKDIGMTAPICANNFSSMPCTFAAGSNKVVVFGLATGVIPADPDGGPWYYDLYGLGGTTPGYTMVASGCPDPGDTTNFTIALKSFLGPNLDQTQPYGLIPGPTTTPGIYHICMRVDVPTASNTPQYQEVTLTAVPDTIVGVIPPSTTLTTDAATHSAVFQLQCLSKVSPQCATSGWTMSSSPNFTMSGDGTIRPNGTVPVGTYNLTASVGGTGPFPFTINVVTPTVWNNGTYGQLLSGLAASNGGWGMVAKYGYLESSTTGPWACNNNNVIGGGSICDPHNGGSIPYQNWTQNGTPAVFNDGVLQTVRRWPPWDFGGGGHSWECGVGYQNYYMEAAANTPPFIQGTRNQLYSFDVEIPPSQIYMIRVNWEGIDGASWYCHDAANFGCQATGQSTLPGPFGPIGWCISPTTWSQAVLSIVKQVRQYFPGVKISITAPFSLGDAQFTDPLIPYIDVWETDVGYWTPTSTETTGQAAWNDPQKQAQLAFMDAYARWTNKPLAFTEWCDGFTDGYIETVFPQWMLAHNTVLAGYWDYEGCDLTQPGFSTTAAALKATVGSVPFAGNPMFPTPKPVP